MFDLGAPELIIILVIVMLLFGVGRISQVGGELGSAIRNFREGLSSSSDEETPKEETSKSEVDEKPVD